MPAINEDDKDLILYLGNLSSNVGSLVEAVKGTTNQLDTLQFSVQELLKAETDRRLEHQETLQNIKRLDSRVDDRKKEISEIKDNDKELAKKIEALLTAIPDKCDDTTSKSSEYTDREITKLYRTFGIVWLVSAFLLGIILNLTDGNEDDIKTHISIVEKKIDDHIAIKAKP